MYYSFLMFLLRVPLFAASASATVALAASGQTALYEIDASLRGTQIYNLFTAITPKGTGTNYPEVVLQTTLPSSLSIYGSYVQITNGLIRYIQGITQTTYNTLLIVKYQASTGGYQEYVVIPSEQIIDLEYFPTQLSQPGFGCPPFTATYPSGVVPYFSVDPYKRAMDIVYAVNQLKNNPTSFGGSSSSQVWIQTGVNGPFIPGLPSPGLLQRIQTIAYSNGMLQITFQTNNNSNISQIVFVSPEQIQQIIWIKNYPFISTL